MSTLRVDSIQDTSGVDNQGKIIQVVNDTTAVARYSSTSTVFADTGFSVTITPKFASSKIKIDLSALVYAGTHYVYLDIYRNATTSLSGEATYGLTGGFAYTSSYWQIGSIFALDSPNTTSAVTYNLYGRTASGSIYVGNQTSAVFPNGVYMTATEIAQ